MRSRVEGGTAGPSRRGRWRRRCRAIGASAILLASLAGGVAAVSGPQLIDFEDLDPGSSQGIPVTDQYAELGIVFEGPTALDDAGRRLADGRVAIRTCWAQEFCDDPLVMHFATPVSHVGLRFGIDGQVVSDGALVLDALDAEGNRRGSADVGLPEGAGPVPVRQALAVDDPEGRITDAVVHTENVPIGMLLFDDVEFVPVEVVTPAPQLLFSGTDAFPGDQVVTITATVANVGDAASAPSAVEVAAEGWPSGSAPLPAIDPGDEATVTVELMIPDAARGTTQLFNLQLDPAGSSGDGDPSDNAAAASVAIPGAEPGAEEATPTPDGSGTTPEPPPGDGLTFVLLGGALVVVVGSGLVIKYRLDHRLITLSMSDKAELELKAEDADPPDTCSRDGAWYCKRSVTFDPRARRITSLGATGTRHGRPLTVSWPDDLRDRVHDAVRHADDAHRPAGMSLADVAAELARSVPGSVDDPTDRLSIAAQVTGSSATGGFTPYRCEVGEDGTGTYRKFARDWKKTLTDRFDRTLAEVDRFDGGPAAIARLESALEAGLRALARDM